jgi:GT2 family glycosyltransferase
MAVHNPPLPFLREAIDSVVGQTSPNWELILSDDGTHDAAAVDYLRAAAESDARVRLVRSEQSLGIVGALNASLRVATSDFVGVLDHDDRLHPLAVELMQEHISTNPDLDLIYSDEDKIDETGRHFDPFFKPTYSPELLLSNMYLNHFTVMRRAAVEEVGAFRAGTDGAQDHDLALRLARADAQIGHQPGVLYHWRAWSESTASGIQAKPWAQVSAASVQGAHVSALGHEPHVTPSETPGLNEVHIGIQGTPLLSIIIPTASTANTSPGGSPTYIEQCLRTIRPLGGWPSLEVVVVHTGRVTARQQAVFDEFGVQVVPYPEPAFNFSTAINTGVAASSGELVLLLNDDTEIARPGSLRAMMEYAQLPGVGAVGARLSFPDGRNQHSGILMVDGLPTHPFHGKEGRHPGYFGSHLTPRNFLAVTGAALMTTRAVFDLLGGLDPLWPRDYQDVDYCLRLRQHGLRVVYTPYAHLVHHENASLVRSAPDPGDTALFRLKWATEYQVDPYYSTLLQQDIRALYEPL